MATLALDPAYRRISVEEFLEMDFGGAKAELEDGLIFMMAGGSEEHSRVATNILVALGPRLRGSGCRPYGSDLAARTEDRSIRFPDVSVYCYNPATSENARSKLIGDAQVIVEVLSPSTASQDQKTKLAEYRMLEGVREIIFVDPRTETIRLVARQGNGWTDFELDPGIDLKIPSLDLVIPRAEIFARD